MVFQGKARVIVCTFAVLRAARLWPWTCICISVWWPNRQHYDTSSEPVLAQRYGVRPVSGRRRFDSQLRLSCLSNSCGLWDTVLSLCPSHKSETRITASVLNNKGFKRTLIYYDPDTQSANFRGNPLRQATKGHLNNSSTVKNDEKWDEKGNTWGEWWWWHGNKERVQKETAVVGN